MITPVKRSSVSSPEAEVKEHDGLQWVFYDGNPIVVLGKRKALPKEYCHVEPGYNVGRCRLIKTDGTRCKNPVREGWTVCRYHGAGYSDNPGGGAITLKNGRYSQYLPNNMLSRFQAFMLDPDSLTLYGELSLVTTRISQLSERLQSCDNPQAWLKVNGALGKLKKLAGSAADVDEAITLLQEAVAAPAAETKIWHEIDKLIDTRRRLSETEQKRIILNKKYLTLQEANAMLAFIFDAVMSYVTDETARAQIASKLRTIMQ